MTSRILYNNPAANNKLGLSYHYEMVSDHSRVNPFKRAIKKYCKGKRILESGIGTGIMSILAARAGAEKIYATEIDPEIAAFAQKNIQLNNFEDKIKIIPKDTRELTIHDLDGEKVDVIIAENLSTWEVNEPQISIMNHVNQNLIKDNGIRIPEIIFNTLELSEAQFRFEEAIDLKTYFFQFTGFRKPNILSKKTLFSKIDLTKINLDHTDSVIEVVVTQKGILNSLRLTSPIKITDGINFDSSDSLMPPVIVPLKDDINVSKGDRIRINIIYHYNTDWKEFSAVATRVNESP